jgi:hypothetical protein
MTIGDLVITPEHTGAIGQVIRILDDGALHIDFTYQPTVRLPFGTIHSERWAESDWHLLTKV